MVDGLPPEITPLGGEHFTPEATPVFTAKENTNITSLTTGKKTSYLVRLGALPSSTSVGRVKPETLQEWQDEFLNDEKKLKCSTVKVSTSDNVNIEMFQMIHPKPGKKWVIAFNPNMGHFQDRLDFLSQYAKKADVNILAVNYRGTGNSEGTPNTLSDLVLDGDAAVQYVMSLGVKPEDILLYGHSIGGSVAAHVAAVNQNTNYIGDRTFDKISNVAKKYLPGVSPSVIKKANWDLDTASQLDKITGRKAIIQHKKDRLIHQEKSSLYAAAEKQMGDKTTTALTNAVENESSDNKTRTVLLRDTWARVEMKPGKNKYVPDTDSTKKQWKVLNRHDDAHNYTYNHLPDMDILVRETKWALKTQ